DDFMRPDRLVLGAIDPRSLKALEDLYDVFPGVERIAVNCRTAEMIKYSSNAMLATLISFSNELANLCASLGGIDAMDVVKGLQASKYLNVETASGRTDPAPIVDFLVPGCGFGGSCLMKDLSALIAHGKNAGAAMRVLESVRDTNLGQPARMAKLLEKRIPDLRGVPVTVLGLAFRPGTSDMRESPAIPVIRDLLARGARVSAFDPALVPTASLSPAMADASLVVSGAPAGSGGPAHPSLWEDAGSAYPGERDAQAAEDTEADRAHALFEGKVRLCRTLEEAVEGARAIVLVTRWHEFRRLPTLIDGAAGADAPVILDGRRMLDKGLFGAYEGIGL
ncbi:MAG TPA: UDP binding domain-containing protein, partial [Fibrobacteria bacterium]|nr:UDP binding domain-containing protein [Fibrobacteria bacterium]